MYRTLVKLPKAFFTLLSNTCFFCTDVTDFLMLMHTRGITGIPFDSEPTDEGYSRALVPIVLKNGSDFDYDSRDSVVYWTETVAGKTEVKSKFVS